MLSIAVPATSACGGRESGNKPGTGSGARGSGSTEATSGNAAGTGAGSGSVGAGVTGGNFSGASGASTGTAVISCLPGEAVCNGVCVDEHNDTNNCGGCGTACLAVQTCQGGTCACLISGQTACGGVCVNEQTDSNNCGQCGALCPVSAPTCPAGSCVCLSATVCGGACVNVQTDPNNCSGCGMTCPTGQACQNGACGNPPSCAASGPGMTNCGASSESCCTSLEVAGGTYNRTYTVGGGGEADPATVSRFRLDKYEVTVGRFRQFVKAVLPPDGGAGWSPSPGSGKHAHLNGGNGLNATGGGYEPGWVGSDSSNIAPTSENLACVVNDGTWTPSAGNNENLPTNCVNWYESYAFCIWDGGFLPSEAEWEYAAAGGSQQREYPWGAADPGAANLYAIYGDTYKSGSVNGTGVSNIAPVGTATRGAGLWGQLDLEGNISEWNLDWYAPYVDPCVDCGSLTPNANRVNRGASFEDRANPFLLSAFRDGDGTPPTSRAFGVGFRCARPP